MGHKQSLNLVDRGLLEDSNGCLRHKCSAYSTVQVIIALSLVEDDKLMACARYEVPYTALVGNIESVFLPPSRPAVLVVDQIAISACSEL